MIKSFRLPNVSKYFLLSWRKKEKLIRNIVFVLFCFKQKKLNLLGRRNHQKQFISVNGKIFCSFLPFVALKTKKNFSKNFSAKIFQSSLCLLLLQCKTKIVCNRFKDGNKEKTRKNYYLIDKSRFIKLLTLENLTFNRRLKKLSPKISFNWD